MTRILKVFVLSAVAALIIAIVGIIWFISIHGFVPESAALVTAWATIVGVVLTQAISAWLATRRAHLDAQLANDQSQVDTLQAYLQEMGKLIAENPELRDLSPDDPSPARILARAHTLTVLRGLDPARKKHVFDYLSDLHLIDTVLNEADSASLIEEIRAQAEGDEGTGWSSDQVATLIRGQCSEFVFIHRAMAANIRRNWTYLDHPALNGNPKAILWITPNWNPGGSRSGTYNDHPIGVWYERNSQRWAIFNQDLAHMPEETAFNVRGLQEYPQ